MISATIKPTRIDPYVPGRSADANARPLATCASGSDRSAAIRSAYGAGVSCHGISSAAKMPMAIASTASTQTAHVRGVTRASVQTSGTCESTQQCLGRQRIRTMAAYAVGDLTVRRNHYDGTASRFSPYQTANQVVGGLALLREQHAHTAGGWWQP